MLDSFLSLTHPVILPSFRLGHASLLLLDPILESLFCVDESYLLLSNDQIPSLAGTACSTAATTATTTNTTNTSSSIRNEVLGRAQFITSVTDSIMDCLGPQMEEDLLRDDFLEGLVRNFGKLGMDVPHYHRHFAIFTEAMMATLQELLPTEYYIEHDDDDVQRAWMEVWDVVYEVWDDHHVSRLRQ